MSIARGAPRDYWDAMSLNNMSLIDLANPTKFLALTARVLPWLAGATAILLAIGLYQSATAPDDYQQGATVKIMFIHVPNAWLSMFVWAVMSAASLGTLVWRHPLADVAAKTAAPIGAAALAATSARGCRQTSVPRDAALITPQTNIDSQAFGTWMNMIFTVAPC